MKELSTIAVRVTWTEALAFWKICGSDTFLCTDAHSELRVQVKITFVHQQAKQPHVINLELQIDLYL